MGQAKRLVAPNEATELLCHRCGQAKPVDEFYPHATIARGRQYRQQDGRCAMQAAIAYLVAQKAHLAA
jgi:2'-5' RNA ligase